MDASFVRSVNESTLTQRNTLDSQIAEDLKPGLCQIPALCRASVNRQVIGSCGQPGPEIALGHEVHAPIVRERDEDQIGLGNQRDGAPQWRDDPRALER